ncbi:hypothetical protein [Flavobacterium sp.]|uniref:hypothetical protein n=1 Tax=Flavobacterium sp. TaxID=239 RepID=UPI002611FFB4|nr:hypothetical protein [Flavobacterium sp.]
MNIIELFENLNIDKSSLLQITSEEIIKIEKQVNVEKKINPDIDVNVANNLIEALKKYPSEFQFIVNNRVLYNLFSKKNYYRDYFPLQNIVVDNERVKMFIENYLLDDLIIFFDKKSIENKFEEMNDLLVYKEYFPEELLYKASKRAEGKLDFVLTTLNSNNSNYFPILHVQEPLFFKFLSHFDTKEINEKVYLLLNKVVSIYNANKNSEFSESIMIAMESFTTFDEELYKTIQSNKEIIINYRLRKKKRIERNKIVTLPFKIIGITIFFVMQFFIVRNYVSSISNSISKTNDYYEDEPIESENYKPVLDRYYLESQSKIDAFKVFLVDYNSDVKNNLTYDNSIKTGQNPFNNVYKNKNLSSSNNNIKFKNTTKYDVILLENSVAFDTINIPNQAYFIKSNQTFELDKSSDFKRTFNFYIGKKLATFHNSKEKLYIHRNSIVEPRFTEFPKNYKFLIKNDYQFDNLCVIKENNGIIEIHQE